MAPLLCKEGHQQAQCVRRPSSHFVGTHANNLVSPLNSVPSLDRSAHLWTAPWPADHRLPAAAATRLFPRTAIGPSALPDAEFPLRPCVAFGLYLWVRTTANNAAATIPAVCPTWHLQWRISTAIFSPSILRAEWTEQPAGSSFGTYARPLPNDARTILRALPDQLWGTHTPGHLHPRISEPKPEPFFLFRSFCPYTVSPIVM